MSPRDRGPGIPGEILCGFWGAFENAYGDPETPLPLLTITPSKVGGSLLPFRCPRCKEVCQEMACPILREDYHDKRPGRNNYFCPSCGLRYKINFDGVALPVTIGPGADVAPSFVERGGVSAWQDKEEESGVFSTVFGLVVDVLLMPIRPKKVAQPKVAQAKTQAKALSPYMALAMIGSKR